MEERPTYRAAEADAAAWQARGNRPKRCRLPRHASVVPQWWRGQLPLPDWSPQQIAAWLVSDVSRRPRRCASRTRRSTARSMCRRAAPSRKKELTAASAPPACNDAGRSRAPTTRGHGQGQLIDIVSIRESGRQVSRTAPCPGHWEGDLLAGTKTSHIATLVERLVAVCPPRATARARHGLTVVQALTRRVGSACRRGLKQSLTWDRGKERSLHKEFTVATDVQVYFGDPRSPWQRGSNENTNGLLRQYFPRKGRDIKSISRSGSSMPSHSSSTHARVKRWHGRHQRTGSRRDRCIDRLRPSRFLGPVVLRCTGRTCSYDEGTV